MLKRIKSGLGGLVRRKAFIAGGLALLVGLSFALFAHVIFGEEFATRQQARMYAPFAGLTYGAGHRGQIRALVVDDASLEEAGQVWPARYSYSARLLQALAQYKPKAVFVDIFYQAQRDDGSISRLVDQLCAMQQQGIPVKLAAVRDAHGEHRLRPELEAVAGRCFEKVSVRYTPDEVDHMAWNYPLHAEQEGAGHGEAAAHGDEHGGEHGAAPPAAHSEPLRSAALALAAEGGGALPHGHHPISLTWGLDPARTGLDWRAAGKPGQSYCRPDHSGWELLPTGLRQLIYGDASEPVCVFHETLRASELSQTTPEEDARLRATLEGKYVVLGLALSGSNDQVLSPVHGRIPGLYLHAMALDNLLTFGARTPVDMHLLDAGSGPAWLFLLVALSVLILTLHWALPELKARREKKHPPQPETPEKHGKKMFHPGAALAFLGMCVLKLAISILLGCLLLWIGQSVFGIGFLSIIGIVFLTVVAEWTEFNEKLLHHLYPAAAESHAHHHPPVTTVTTLTTGVHHETDHAPALPALLAGGTGQPGHGGPDR
jgi:CHASE2 domain-containing sensor protein